VAVSRLENEAGLERDLVEAKAGQLGIVVFQNGCPETSGKVLEFPLQVNRTPIPADSDLATVRERGLARKLPRGGPALILPRTTIGIITQADVWTPRVVRDGTALAPVTEGMPPMAVTTDTGMFLAVIEFRNSSCRLGRLLIGGGSQKRF
jgi:hypothetical protein